jgi:hypothetical protein
MAVCSPTRSAHLRLTASHACNARHALLYLPQPCRLLVCELPFLEGFKIAMLAHAVGFSESFWS